MAKSNGILAMNPEQYREIDVVVFDLDSYAKHCRPVEQTPEPIFPAAPYPAGWYPVEEGQAPVPVMGGALPPLETVVTEDGITIRRTVWVQCGSGSGSYLTSYTTSYRTSYRSSGSGSHFGGSCTYFVGGYGLELI